jgi:predicted transposase YdaD
VKEEQTFQAEIDKLDIRQKETIMYTMTSWEEKGLAKGLEQGRRLIALNMLQANLPIEQIVQLTELPLSEMEAIANEQHLPIQN